jgi:hypothetical protein
MRWAYFRARCISKSPPVIWNHLCEYGLRFSIHFLFIHLIVMSGQLKLSLYTPR